MLSRIENKAAEKEEQEVEESAVRAACSINNNLIIKWIMYRPLCGCVC